MIESIQKVDLNYTNAGGGHTASVSSVVGGKRLSGDDGLGSVIGGAGEDNNFSNPKIEEAMQRFECTTLTTATDPVKSVRTRKYVDKTSLKLKSLIVLVRGINCSPEGGEGHLNIPFWSEVSNSPLTSFKSQGPVRKGSVIEVGRIYNVEEASDYMGVKAFIVYNNKKLKRNLSLNLDFVSDSYEANPDLSQFQLKFGYTLNDFRSMMADVGIEVSGLPTSSDFNRILFQNSGTLASVVGAVAAFLGCFWYVDPKSGGIAFVNTAIASEIPIRDYTSTTDKNIVGATFTEDYTNKDIVNVYLGTTQKPQQNGGGGGGHGDGARTRSAYFRRVQIESLDVFKDLFQKKDADGNLKTSPIQKVLGAYFAIFNQEQGQEIFDKYTYLLTFYEAANNFKRFMGDEWKNWTIKPVYPHSPAARYPHPFSSWKMIGERNERFPMIHDPKVNGESGMALYGLISEVDGPTWHADGKANQGGKLNSLGRKTSIRGYHRCGIPLKNGFLKKAINKFFSYYAIMTEDEIGKTSIMPRPSQGSDLWKFLENYFKMGWGVWVSNGYAEYKAARMQFTNTNPTTVVGPFHKNSFIDEHQELSGLDDLLQILMKGKRISIKQLAENSNPKARTLNDWHFIAFQTLPKLPQIRVKNPRAARNVKEVDFTDLKDNFEYFKPPKGFSGASDPDTEFIGGPAFDLNQRPHFWRKLNSKITGMVKQSYANYSAATEWNKSTSIKYDRSKTRVNKIGDDGEEMEDDVIADSPSGEQQKSDLFDRWDTRYYGIEKPEWNLLNQLSLASSSGSTLEMMLLRQQRQNYPQVSDQKVHSSSRSMYGLHIPDFEPQMNSVSLSVGNNGVTTTIGESTIKLIPPDQGLIQNEAMETLTPKSLQSFGEQLNAGQRNMFGI